MVSLLPRLDLPGSTTEATSSRIIRMGTNNKNLTDLENLRFFISPAYNKRVDSRFIIWAGVPPWEKPPAAPRLPGVNGENGVENDMKRKLMKAGVVALAIALFAACGSGDEPRNSTDAETGTSRTETSAAARTPAPMPTRPKRIDHLLTPMALAGAIKEKPAKTSEPEAKQAGREPASDGAAKAVTGDPMTIAELVPEDPRTNDQVLLQDIYAQIHLEQFALDPDQPIPWQGSKYDADSPIERDAPPDDPPAPLPAPVPRPGGKSTQAGGEEKRHRVFPLR